MVKLPSKQAVCGTISDYSFILSLLPCVALGRLNVVCNLSPEIAIYCAPFMETG
jgi:hypothetical protein